MKWFLLLLMFPLISFAQNVDYIEEMENNDLRIRQKPSTERLLSDYLRSVPIQEDTVYAILYIPAACYRCEAAIPAFYKLLKNNNPDNKMLLVSAYADSTAAAWYNNRSNYKADYYLYDTDSDYKNIFSFNTGFIDGLYVLKLCPASGTLITGGEYTYLGEDFISQLVACRTRMAPYSYPADTEEYAFVNHTEDISPYPWKTAEYPLALNEDVPVSTVYDIPKIENGRLFFNDMLNNGIMYFQLDEGRYVYKDLIQANDDEKTRFVEISDSLFQEVTAAGQVFYIALSSNMLDERHLAVSYSLPMILSEIVGEVTRISFYNAPAILIRDMETSEPGKMVTPEVYGQEDYFYKHFTFDIFDDKLWVGCQKLTWPMDGFEREDVEGNVELDPFNEGFYDTFNPIVASFDIDSGACDGLYGSLDDSQRKSRTGYWYTNNIFAHYKESFLYANGYTGKLYVSADNHVDASRCYDVFDMDTASFSAPDSTFFYTREYGNLYDSNFNRCITAVKMNETQICCLVKYGNPGEDDFLHDRYSFVTVDRETGETQERFLPVVTPEMTCLGYGIRNERNAFNPFLFVKDASGHKILDLQLSE